jgi:hypothetical protein
MRPKQWIPKVGDAVDSPGGRGTIIGIASLRDHPRRGRAYVYGLHTFPDGPYVVLLQTGRVHAYPADRLSPAGTDEGEAVLAEQDALATQAEAEQAQEAEGRARLQFEADAHHGAEANKAYRRFILHVKGCSKCDRAGGESAAPRNLCQVGRTLLKQWDRAEREYARAMVRAANET